MDFQGIESGQTISVDSEDYTATPRLTYDSSLLTPSRRLLVNDTDVNCAWTTTVSGDVSTTECEEQLLLENDTTVILRAEAYLPPDHVIKSAEITVQFGNIRQKINIAKSYSLTGGKSSNQSLVD